MRTSMTRLLVFVFLFAAVPAVAAQRTFDLTASRFQYDVSPGGAIVVDQGDVVTLRITAVDVTHGFAMSPYVTSKTINVGTTVQVTFTAHTAGSFQYACTRVCGEGHGDMNGIMVVVAGAATLTVTDVEPAGGSTAGGTAVTISGTGFEDGATVKFDSIAASNVIVVNPSTITAVTPGHAPEVVDVTVTNLDAETATLSDAYTYANPPSITSIEPDAGPAGGGTSVTITGTGFKSGAAVRFASKLATGVSVPNSTTITATTPSGTPGPVDVTVTNPDSQSVTASGAYTYVAGPSISSVAPSSGPTSGGTAVTISGSGFQSGATVRFGEIAATGVNTISSSTITATTPPHAQGTVGVTVTNPDSSSATLENAFTFSSVTITEIVPDLGPVTGGTAFILSGSGFTDGAMVLFDGIGATGVVVQSSTTITGITPAHPPGSVSVTVQNPGGASATLEQGFIYSSSSSRRRGVRRPGV